MGTGPLQRQPPASPAQRPIAAFDFDGTLTIADSYTAFLRWRAGPWRWAAGLARLAPAMAAWLAHRDRGRLKAATTRVFLRGVARAQLEADAEGYAASAFEALIRPDALAAWRAHGEAGDERVIVTASPETVVAPFAARLDADRLIGTRLAFDAADRATGGFAGANCRSAEKVVRLEAAYGDGVRLAAAYGDTGGDREMLAIAERPGWRVFTGRAALRHEQSGRATRPHMTRRG